MIEQKESEIMSLITVLLAEDHALTRIGLRIVLKRVRDIVVIGESSHGQEAVADAVRLKPNVVLMDVGMPVMDGIQAASEIISKYPDIKIIMLTQHDNEQDVLASLAAGASGYCLKDVIPERLYTAIRAVNAGDVWLDASIASKVLKHYHPLNFVESTSVSKAHSVQDGAHSAKGARLDRPLPEPLSARELEVLR